jgi:hypothetical protein
LSNGEPIFFLVFDCPTANIDSIDSSIITIYMIFDVLDHNNKVITLHSSWLAIFRWTSPRIRANLNSISSPEWIIFVTLILELFYFKHVYHLHRLSSKIHENCLKTLAAHYSHQLQFQIQKNHIKKFSFQDAFYCAHSSFQIHLNYFKIIVFRFSWLNSFRMQKSLICWRFLIFSMFVTVTNSADSLKIDEKMFIIQINHIIITV